MKPEEDSPIPLPGEPAQEPDGFPVERWPLLISYAATLATTGVERGFIGPREVDRLWERHLLNCLPLSELIPGHSRVVDVGTGAGLPGMVLAIARPDLEVTLLDSLRKRCVFLEEVAKDLGLTNIVVIHGRAEELKQSFDVVTSRAVAPLPRLLEWCLPLVAAGGRIVAMKGQHAAAEVEESRLVLRQWRCATPVLTQVEDGLSTTVIVEVSFSDPLQVGLGFLTKQKGKRRGRS